MTKRKRPAKRIRPVGLFVYVTVAERQRVKGKAEQLGLTMAEYVRQVLLEAR